MSDSAEASQAAGTRRCQGDAPDPLPSTNAEYLSSEYWDRRFEAEQSYEWFKSFSEFSATVTACLRPHDRILILGCGSSAMPLDLYQAGFRNIVSTDLSPVVIATMRARAAAEGCDGIQWAVADMCNLAAYEVRMFEICCHICCHPVNAETQYFSMCCRMVRSTWSWRRDRWTSFA